MLELLIVSPYVFCCRIRTAGVIAVKHVLLVGALLWEWALRRDGNCCHELFPRFQVHYILLDWPQHAQLTMSACSVSLPTSCLLNPQGKLK
jgi:hypothetical protein